jgi:hypothetical protein
VISYPSNPLLPHTSIIEFKDARFQFTFTFSDSILVWDISKGEDRKQTEGGGGQKKASAATQQLHHTQSATAAADLQ